MGYIAILTVANSVVANLKPCQNPEFYVRNFEASISVVFEAPSISIQLAAQKALPTVFTWRGRSPCLCCLELSVAWSGAEWVGVDQDYNCKKRLFFNRGPHTYTYIYI